MFSKELVPLLLQIISSWQVIAVTIAIILYFSLVSYVTRRGGRSRYGASIHSNRKKKTSSKSKQSSAAETSSGSVNDELGLEER
jgi:hypothetical protein